MQFSPDGPTSPPPQGDSARQAGPMRPPPAQRRGAAGADSVPRMETVRVTAPDLRRRAAQERTRMRLVIAAGGFVALFLAVVVKLADATILQPRAPHRPERKILELIEKPRASMADAFARRAMITDRNGQILAISLPTVALFADPRQVMDPAEDAHRLKQVLPGLDQDVARERLSESTKQFVFLARRITPQQEIAVNNLGLPGIDFLPSEERHYPMGRVAAHVLGGVDIDEHGVAGVEKWFDKRMMSDPSVLRLSLDVRVQAVVREELAAAMEQFKAIGAAGIVMDVTTGEVLALVSLPDYEAGEFGHATEDERFNRAVSGAYEPGSTFKLQTVAMALDDDVVHLWDSFDTIHPIHIGRFTITDFEPEHHNMEVPEIIARSSNIGASHIALEVGADRQRAWLRKLGYFARSPIQLPESAAPLVQPASAWKTATVMTVSFGNGIAVTPAQLIAGTSALIDGGISAAGDPAGASARGGAAGRAGRTDRHLRDHAQAHADRGDARHRQAGRGARLSDRRQNRNFPEGRQGRLQAAREPELDDRGLPDVRPALHRVRNARHAACRQDDVRVYDRRLDSGAGGQADHYAHRPDAGRYAPAGARIAGA